MLHHQPAKTTNQKPHFHIKFQLVWSAFQVTNRPNVFFLQLQMNKLQQQYKEKGREGANNASI